MKELQITVVLFRNLGINIAKMFQIEHSVCPHDTILLPDCEALLVSLLVYRITQKLFRLTEQNLVRTFNKLQNGIEY